MPINKILVDLDIDGKLLINNIPNNAGNVLTVASDGKTVSNRTFVQILSDLNAYSKPEANNLFAYATGSNATGTWGINISGTATNSSGWNNQQYNTAENTAIDTYILAYGVNSSWHPTTQPVLKSWLNLGTISTYNVGDTIGINITGSAQSANILNSKDGSRDANSFLPNANANAIRYDFVNASSTGTGGKYAGLMSWSPWTGTVVSTGDASYQLAMGSGAVNATGVPMLRIRNGIDTTWNNWYDVYTSANLTSLSQLTNNLGNYGGWIVGDGTQVAGFAGNDAGYPYLRHSTSNEVIRLLRYDQVSNSAFITADSNPSANTIAARDVNGYLIAGYIQTAVSAANPISSGVISLYGNNNANGYHYAVTAPGVKTFLNYSGNEIITDPLNQAEDILVSKYMRWAHYGSSHVILDASNAVGYNGTVIPNSDAQIGWTPTYPTLVGFNGVNSFGVRVDSARVADSAANSSGWNNQQYNTAENTAIDTYILAYGVNSSWHPTTQPVLKSWLNSTLDEVATNNPVLNRSIYLNSGQTMEYRNADNSLAGRADMRGDILHQYVNRISDTVPLAWKENWWDGTKYSEFSIDSQGFQMQSQLTTFGLTGSDGSATYTGGLMVQQTNPGITFHYPGNYACNLWMNAAGQLNWQGTGLNLPVNGTINSVIGGVTGDPYGVIAVTAPADSVNRAYFGMTKSGVVGIGIGIDSLDRFIIGGGSSARNGYAITNPHLYLDSYTASLTVIGNVTSNKFISNNGFKSTNFCGIIGDYDVNGSTDKIIWTIGDTWNTLASVYGLGYNIEPFAGYGHSIFFGSAGVKRIQFSLDNGSANFLGTINAGNLAVNGYSVWHTGNFTPKTNLSQLVNDLGNYGNWITKAQGDTYYQPLENQRLSTTNTVTFNTVTAAHYYKSSDMRLKKLVDKIFNVRDIKLRAYIKDSKLEVGYFAQDVQKVLPCAISETPNTFLDLDYTQVLVQKVQHLEDDLAQAMKQIKIMQQQINQLLK